MHACGTIMLMNDIYIAVVLGVLGATLGSYAGALVWRLRARHLQLAKAENAKVDAKELKRLKPLTQANGLKDRSIDLDTGKQLKWYDMIPVFSYIFLRGKSRYSGKPIGKGEFLIEAGLAAFFVISFLFWPHGMGAGLEIAQFAVWLASGVGLAVLFSYDARWFMLPLGVNALVIALGAVYAFMHIIASPDYIHASISLVASILILSGLYWLLYTVSRGKWVGDGDIVLGLGLALLLADWQLAFLALFAANLIGTLIVLPPLLLGKMKRGAHVPFGPLLIAGAVVAQIFGPGLIDAYFSLFTI